MEEKVRTAVFYKDYFNAFFIKQRKKVQDKILWTIKLLEQIERVPETYLKYLGNGYGLYEIRIQSGNDIFRVFCFFDENHLVIFANDFQKKTQKTPRPEIENALKN